MSAVEQFDSRFGNSGVGNWNRTRRFHVTVPSEIPVEYQDPFSGKYSGLPKLGSGFGTFPGVLVTGYTLVERLSLRDWIVDVNYGIPPLLTPTYGGQWRVSVSSSLESVKQDVTTLDPIQIEDGVVPEIVGPWYYTEIGRLEEPPSETYIAKSKKVVNQVVKVEDKELKRLDLRKREGMQVTVPVATLTLQRQFFHPANYAQALARISMVNDSFFYGASRGQLKLMSVSMSSFLVPSAIVFSVGSDVTLNFQWRTNGHQHTIMHQYEDPDDSTLVSPIRRLSGTEDLGPVIESFSTYLETSFSAMLSGFSQQ